MAFYHSNLHNSFFHSFYRNLLDDKYGMHPSKRPLNEEKHLLPGDPDYYFICLDDEDRDIPWLQEHLAEFAPELENLV